jgi:hypothetical protein
VTLLFAPAGGGVGVDRVIFDIGSCRRCARAATRTGNYEGNTRKHEEQAANYDSSYSGSGVGIGHGEMGICAQTVSSRYEPGSLSGALTELQHGEQKEAKHTESRSENKE